MGIRFEEPADEVPRTEAELRAAAAQLRARPGRWALLGQVPGGSGAARTYAWSLRHDRVALPGRAFDGDGHRYEVTAGRVINENRVYARYLSAE
jgi:hypothetical protein